MNKKFFIAWIAIFIVWMFGSFVVHGLLLSADYKALQSMFRSGDVILNAGQNPVVLRDVPSAGLVREALHDLIDGAQQPPSAW